MIQGPANPKYKTSMCKHFNTPQGCSYGDKCQFAHGSQELRLSGNGPMPIPQQNKNKMQNNIINFKIAKCKNWEKDKTCKYGVHCTFAHGDEELRNKVDNMIPIGPGFPMMMPMMYDMSQMNIIMQQNPELFQMQMMGQNQNPLMMNMMPNNMNNTPSADKTNDDKQQ